MAKEKKKVPEYITDNTDIFSDGSDWEDSDEINSDEENFNQENFDEEN